MAKGRKKKSAADRIIAEMKEEIALSAKLGRLRKPPKNPHKAVRKSCMLCGGPHTIAQHRSHGVGSFARTHKG